MDDWRTFLYPLGFLSSFVFGGRFLVQWAASEKAGRTVVPTLFWQLSLLGNLLLLIHSMIQFQLHLCLFQAINGVISWRNLDLLQNKHPPKTFGTVIFLFITSIFSTIALFAIQDLWLQHEPLDWFRAPATFLQISSDSPISLLWHCIGLSGYLLFNSRFWLQWWLAEKNHKSELTPSFWWFSLIGMVISTVYFFRTSDLVQLVGPLIALVPYIRNLMLARQHNIASESL